MPRLIKRKKVGGDGDGERAGHGDDALSHARPTDESLSRNKQLLMAGKLPALSPQLAAEGRSLSAVEAGRSPDVATATGRRILEFDAEEAAPGFRRRLSTVGTKRPLIEEEEEEEEGEEEEGEDPVAFAGGHRARLNVATKAMTDRLSGQKSQLQRGAVMGQFRGGGDRESGGHFTKMKILALNESSSDDSESEVEMETSKEAQEAEGYSLYNKALDLQQSGSNDEAETVYKQLLNIPFLAELEPPDDDETVVRPGLMLKYSANKNLASMAYQKGDLTTAMQHYLEAVLFDESDVTVWYRIGTIAVTLLQLPLASLSFMQALRCSPTHWPSLDRLCTVLYALNDYATCLYYICQAFEKDCYYKKGVVLREKMFQEQPSLRKDSYDLFRTCQDVIPPSRISKAEAEKIIREALTMRRERRALGKRTPLPLVKFLTPFASFASFTWKGLGERLVELYNHLANSPPPLGLCCKIDLSEFIQHPDDKTNSETGEGDYTSPMDTAPDRPPVKPQDVPQSGPHDGNVECITGDGQISSEGSVEKSAPSTPIGTSAQTSEETSLRTSAQVPMQVSELDTPMEVVSDDAPMDASESIPNQTVKATEVCEEAEQTSGGTSPRTSESNLQQEAPLPDLQRSQQSCSPESLQQNSTKAPHEVTEEAMQTSPSHTKETSPDARARVSPQTSQEAKMQPVEQNSQSSQTSQETSHGTLKGPSLQLPSQSSPESSSKTQTQTSFQNSPQTSLKTSPQTQTQTSQQTSPHTQTSQQTSPPTQTSQQTSPPTQTSPSTHSQALPQTPQQAIWKGVDRNGAVAMETEPVPVKKKGRRGPKRKREKTQNPIPGNRRSTRVRNTAGKKKEETVNYQEILWQFLPSSLRDSGKGDDSETTDCTSAGNSEIRLQKSPPSSKTEAPEPAQKVESTDAIDASQSERVWAFLASWQRNSGITQVLNEYLQVVAALPGTWPSGLAGVFLQGYARSRRHVMLPNIFSSEYSDSRKTTVGFTILTAAELKVDQIITGRQSTPSSASKKTDIVSLGQFMDDDMTYLQMLTTGGVLPEERWLEFTMRVSWLQARYKTLLGRSEEAIDAFDVCTEILSGDGRTDTVIYLPNCRMDGKITLDLIKEQLKSTQHSQSLEEVQRFYDAGNYERVASLLLPTFKDAAATAVASCEKVAKDSGRLQRPSQLLLLHRSLNNMKDYKQCVVCGAAAILEALQEVSVAVTTALRDEWISVLMELFAIINNALCEEVGSLKGLERPQRVRFTSAIISVIELSMDAESSFPADVLPWVVLYRLIKYEETQLASKEIGVTVATSDAPPMIPSSLMLLDTAHDYLGRRSWCCNSNGAFVRLYISVLSREITTGTEEVPHPFLSDLQYSLEQCFFCLHGHPSKKTKARHLQDHGVEELPMTMDDASLIFDYFKPSVLPEFDSYKTSSLSGDLESLLLKIVRIIPPMDDPPVTMETLQSYIEAKTDDVPCIPKDKPILRPVVKEIYYLLADFYFKNKEFVKAIKLYMQDICVCPERQDSWAGMALARSGRLEVKFNTCDSKTEGTIYKHSEAALRCFQRALEIDSSNRSLWIEYGSMAYMVHSYASRQLKQKEQFALTDDILEFLEEKRSECLSLAEKCFTEALGCEVDGEEEEWLVHYMLGKVSEKGLKDPSVFLDHYKKAAYYLHEDEAKYPKKIAYHNPPDLSLEALEMYFRLHASIVKLLQKTDESCHDNYALLQEYVADAIDAPFVTAQEKTDSSEQLSSADNDLDTKSPVPGIRGQSEDRGQQEVKGQEVKPEKTRVPGSPLFIATPTDHDYVRSRGRKRQHGKKLTDDPSSDSLPACQDDSQPGSSVRPSDGKDALSTAGSAAALLKSFAEIHTGILDGTPAEKKPRLEIAAVPAQQQERKTEPSTTSDSEGLSQQSRQPLAGEPSTRIPDQNALESDPAKTTDESQEERQTGDEEKRKDDDGERQASLEAEDSSEIVEGRRDAGRLAEASDVATSLPDKMTRDVATNSPMMPEEEATETAVAPATETFDASIIVISSEESQEEMETDAPPQRVAAGTASRPPSGDKMSVGTDSEPEAVATETVLAKKASGGSDSVIIISSEESDGSGEKEEEEDSSLLEREEKEQDDRPKMAAVEADIDPDSRKGTDAMMTRELDAKPEAEEIQKDDLRDEIKAAKDPCGSEKGVAMAEEEDGRSQEEKKAWLVDKCLEAMRLCLSRFPQHYKSLYRMAHAYSLAKTDEGLRWSRDLLLGSNQPWQQMSHMPSPGLFSEHWKTKNLFHGVWRIPISEIDRSGSFPWHMYRSVRLLIDILSRLHDHAMLLQIAIKLNRTPEREKKFLRDVDRQYLAKHCYKTCLEVLEEDLVTVSHGSKEEQLQVLLAAYRLLQTVQNKLQVDARLPARLLCLAYSTYKDIRITSDIALMDQAVRFCLQYRTPVKTPTTPTAQPETMFSSPQHGRDKSQPHWERSGEGQTATPSKALVATPSNLQVATPIKVQVATPIKVQLAMPSKVQLATPSNLQVATPSNLQVAMPIKVQVATPSKVQLATPSNLQVATPSNLQVAMPIKVQVATPSKVQLATPSNLQVATHSNLQVAMPSKAQVATPSNRPTMPSGTQPPMPISLHKAPPVTAPTSPPFIVYRDSQSHP